MLFTREIINYPHIVSFYILRWLSDKIFNGSSTPVSKYAPSGLVNRPGWVVLNFKPWSDLFVCMFRTFDFRVPQSASHLYRQSVIMISTIHYRPLQNSLCCRVSSSKTTFTSLQSGDLESFKQVKSVSRTVEPTQNGQLLNTTFAWITPFVIYALNITTFVLVS